MITVVLPSLTSSRRYFQILSRRKATQYSPCLWISRHTRARLLRGWTLHEDDLFYPSTCTTESGLCTRFTWFYEDASQSAWKTRLNLQNVSFSNTNYNDKMYERAVLVHLSYLARRTGSTPTVGSSRMTKGGFWSRATAKDTRRCCPPLETSVKRRTTA